MTNCGAPSDDVVKLFTAVHPSEYKRDRTNAFMTISIEV